MWLPSSGAADHAWPWLLRGRCPCPRRCQRRRRDGAEHCAASVVRWPVYTVVGAHLARDGDLLHDGVAEHAGLFLCAGRCGGRQTVKAMAFFMGFSRETGATP
jgi:hypothetical protein